MTDQQKKIDLVVQAKINGTRELKAVAGSIEDISTALDKQNDAAKRGVNVYDQLKAAQAALATEQKQLADSLQALQAYEKLNGQIAENRVKVLAAKTALEQLDTELKKQGTATKAQQNNLLKLDKTYTALNTKLARQLTTQSELGQVLEKAGLRAGDYAGSMAQIETAILRATQVQGKASESIRDYAKNALAAKEADIAAALALKQKTQAEADLLAKQLALVKSSEAIAAAVKDANAAFEADNKLNTLADNAERSTRALTSLSRASANLKPSILSVRDAVSSILNPGEKLQGTLTNVEQEVSSLAVAVGKIKGPVQDYKTTLASLESTQKSLTQQASLVDNFRQQTEALRLARTEVSLARVQVAGYAAAVRQGGSEGQGFVKALADAQVRARGAAEALAAQLTVTRASRQALRDAGIAANDLATAESRIKGAAMSAETSTRSLTAAVNEFGVAQDKATSKGGKGLFDVDGGRTTLSFIQRLKGEILALAAAYGGLYSVINVAQGAVSATNDREAVKNQISLAVGNTKALIDAEYDYAKAQSDRIGLEFDKATLGYAKLLVGIKASGRTIGEAKYIFEAFSEVAKVAGLSGAELEGVFRALGQSYSKQKVQAEELLQLSERIPGVLAFAQEALRSKFPDLQKALQEGKVGSENLLLIAQKYRTFVADRLPDAMKSTAAAQARFTNSVLEFKTAVGDNGYVDAYTTAIKTLTNFLKSADGAKAAQQFASTLVAVAKAVTFIGQQAEYLQPLLEVLAGFLLFKTAMAGVTSLTALSAALSVVPVVALPAAASLTTLSGAVAALATALGAFVKVVAVAFIGWQIGTIAREKFSEVRVAGIYMVTSLLEIFQSISGGWAMLWAAFPSIVKNQFALVINTMTLLARKSLDIFAQVASALGLDSLSKALLGTADAISIGYKDVGDAVAGERAKMDTELKRIRQLRKDMLADEKAASKSLTTPGVVTPGAGGITPFPNVPPTPPKVDEAEIKKRASLIQSLDNSLSELDAKIARKDKESLSALLSAVDDDFKKYEREIQEHAKVLGAKTAAVYLKSFNERRDALKQATRNNFYDNLEKETLKLDKKVSDIEVAGGKKSKNDTELRLAAIRQSYESHYKEIDKLRTDLLSVGKDTAEIDALKKRSDAAVEQLQNLERIKIAQEELVRLEAYQNDQIKLRDLLIENQNQLKAQGKITDEQNVTAVNAIYDQMQPKIVAALEATRLWAIENAKIFAKPEDQAIFLATLDATKAKVTEVTAKFTELQTTAIGGAIKAVDVGLNSVVDNLTKVAAGQASVAEGFRGILQSFAQFAAQFLRDIAIMIIKQQIFNALKNSGNPILATIGQIGSAGVKHSGGVIGSFSGTQRTRSVPSEWFSNAPRYHSGGVPGLAADEYATILQKGEEVLSKDSPRNIMNGGGKSAGVAPTSGVRVVLVDDRARVPEAMSGAEGDQVIIQSIRKNQATIKAMLR